MNLRETINVSLENDDVSCERVVMLGGDTRPEVQQKLVEMLEANSTNAVVQNFSMETQQLMEEAKKQVIASLFVVTPKQTGFGAIAEATKAAMSDPEHTAIVISDDEDGTSFDEDQKKSNDVFEAIIKGSGAQVFHSLNEASDWVNKMGAGTGDL